MDLGLIQQKLLAEGGDSNFRLLRVVCNDRRCQNTMFVSSLEGEIECFHCGQKTLRNSLREVQQLPSAGPDFVNGVDLFIRRLILNNCLPKRGTEMVKVLGLSNYYCKILSPFLTRYGMDKESGKAKLLKDMNRGDIFDCSSFGDRAFLIEPEHVNIPGFGRDITGSMLYLSETLKLIKSSNEDQERLLPIHTDGDGHCLVHAISRALVGRELFWHPLRCSLKTYFETNLDKFKELFKDFIDTEEWQSIIDECDPEFKPPEGELHGLRNIHIFGLANVLRRPIILLDAVECMMKIGDYSAIFLPGLVDAEGCKGRDRTLNKPICIAWSSNSHNHYIPLVGIRNMPLPVLPLSLLPKVWGMPQTEINTYIEFDNGNCTIGGCRVLSDSYIQRLVVAMEGQFYEQYQIHPSLVADTKLFLCADNVLLNTHVTAFIQKAKAIIAEERLFRCMHCKALCEMRIDPGWLCPGGALYVSLFQTHENLIPGESYKIKMPVESNICLHCKYDSLNDILVPDMSTSFLVKCCWCQSNVLMKLSADGSFITESNSDMKANNNPLSQGQDKSVESPKKQVTEDVPEMFSLKIRWRGKEAEDVIPDFKLVKRECLSEAVIKITSSFICKHFPEYFPEPALHSLVVEKIVERTGLSALFGKKSSSESKDPEKEVIEASTVMEEDSGCPPQKASRSITSTETRPPSSISEPQFVKVVSPNAQAANLTLSENGISYTQLQEWIKETFSIPIPNQRIKTGFPPKELEVPVSPTQPLLLKHGDRLVVENCPKQASNRPSSACVVRNTARDFSTQKPLTAYQSDVLWNLAKLSPDQFRKGGSFYEEVAGSRILCDMVHFFIEKFPNKTFSYNHHSDSIELCVKPLGHFEISVDLDSRIEQVQEGESVKGYRKCPVMSLKTGPKDSIVNKTIKKNLPSSAQSSSESQKAAPLVRKGPGFSILTSPETSETMDIS